MLALELDHVGVAVKSLDRGRDVYARLGFTLTARSFHSGSRTPGAPAETWGSGNHCAMFREGYLEIIGLTDPDQYSSVKDMVARYEGLHIIAIGVDPPTAGGPTVGFEPGGRTGASVDAAREALLARGVPVEAPRSLERDAAFGPQDAEVRRAKFRNCYLDRQKYPEGRFLYIQHLTREVLWQPHLLAHANGAVGIDEAWFASDDPVATRARLAPVFPDPVRGRFLVVSPSEWPFRPLPPLPSPVGFGIRVESLDRTRRYLASQGIAVTEDQGALWVGPADACSSTLRFHEKESTQ